MPYGTAERPAVLTEDTIRAELVQILSSQAFARSERQRRFLRHAVEAAIEGRSQVLKESLLGVAIFNRGPDFDPRSDNIVRVEARRLRQRLQDYYQTEGSTRAVLIDLPTGAYIPQFSWRTAVEPAPVPRPKLTIRHAAVAVTALVLIATAAVLWATQREPPLIAVLPFNEYNAGDAGPYRGDSIADDILQLLAETPRLRVVSRTSTFRFRGKSADLPEIRRRLGVEFLLEGSVQKVGDRIRIAARLVDGSSGVPRWAETRETDAAGLDRAERGIAAAVAAVLKAGKPRPVPGHTPPSEARDQLARARYLVGKGGTANRQRALEHYARTVALDPNYAQAWGELARLLSLIAFHDSAAAGRLAPQIQDAAARALRLDAWLADPHCALARLAWSHDWDWNAAERGWKKTLEINPNYAGAHQAYALGLVTRRRFREAEAHSRRAMELDPMAFAASNDLGVVLYLSRQFDKAATHARMSISLAPESPSPHFLMGVVDVARDRSGRAPSELDRAAAARARDPEILGRLGNVHARAGRRAEARAVLAELERNPDAAHIYTAMVETGLGNRNRAIDLLAMSVDKRESDVVFLGVDPVFDPLRQDARFAVLCRRLGVPVE
jgi:serine/threonine-protein kinase